MARVLGADFAEQLQAPLDAGMVRAALRAKVHAHDYVTKYVAAQKEIRRFLQKQQQRPDALGYGGLFAHQRVDLQYLSNVPLPAYLLAHDPGVGKTAVAIRWVADQLQAHRALVICPNSAKSQWAQEIRQWDPRFPDVYELTGTIKEQEAMINYTDSGWLVAHWESLVHARSAFVRRGWDVIIADEAHLAANRQAERTKTLHKMKADYRMALTGHPYARHPGELWAILHFLYPDHYTSYWRFFHLYVDWFMDRFGRMEETGAKRPKLLRWSILPFTLRRTKQSLGLLPPTRTPRHAYMTDKYRREYDKLKKQMFVELEGREKKLPIIDAMVRSTRIRQWLIDPGLIGGTLYSLKYPLLRELLTDLPSPPVIFTQFRQAMLRAIEWLNLGDGIGKKYRFGMIAGNIPQSERGKIIRRYLNGDLSALFVVAQAGGLSLNLGGHGYAIFLDLPWTARDYEQMEGRVDRPSALTGKRIAVTTYRIIIKNSFEDRIMEPLLNNRFAEFGKTFPPGHLRELLG